MKDKQKRINNPDIERWKERLNRSEITQAEFDSLMRGKKSLEEMKK